MGLLLFERSPGKFAKTQVFFVLLIKCDKMAWEIDKHCALFPKMWKSIHFSTHFEPIGYGIASI